MPILDKPLSELRTYTGTNPCPDDLELYWERALSDLDGVDPDVEFRKSDFRVSGYKCEDLYFTGTRGARIHSKLIRPETGEGLRAVLRFHGYSMDSGDWSEHLSFAGAGFVVAALDCRGQGGSSEDVGGVRGNTLHGHIIRGLEQGADDLLFRDIFLDTVRLARVVMDLDEVDPDRVGATGGSQGGGLTLACASLEPRIARAASVFPFLSDYKRVWDMDLVNTAYREMKDYFRHFDPTHETEDEVFRRLGYIDVHNLAPRIQANTLMLISQMDETCPPSTQFAAFNNIRSEKEYVVYPDFGHENLPGGSDRVFQHMLGL